MAKAPKGVFGGGSDAPADDMPDDEPSGYEDEDDPEDDSVPPEFESAYDEYEQNPSAATAYRMIEACKGSGGGGGLALLLGPKGKKP